MQVTIKDKVFGEGTEVEVESQVLVKKKRMKTYRYCKKVGKRYIMAPVLSLQYIATVLWHESGENRNLVICLNFGSSYITCLFHNESFDTYVDEDITEERYVAKFRDIYLPAKTFILYSNASITIPGRDVTYLPLNDETIKKVIKTTVPPVQIAALVVMIVVTLIMARLVYTHIINPKKTTTARPETLEEVYHQFLAAQMASSASKVGRILSARLDSDERISVLEGDNVTVESLVYKPSSVQDGYLYKRTMNYSLLPVKGSAPGLPLKYPAPAGCPETVSGIYKVVSYKTEQVKGKPYIFQEAALEAKVATFAEAAPLLEDSVRRCVVIKNIRYNKEGGFQIEASKYAKNRQPGS